MKESELPAMTAAMTAAEYVLILARLDPRSGDAQRRLEAIIEQAKHVAFVNELAV